MQKNMKKKYKVIITDFITDSLAIESEILGDAVEVIALNAYNEKELDGTIEEVDAIIMYHTLSLTSKTINHLRQCKLIIRAGVGFP